MASSKSQAATAAARQYQQLSAEGYGMGTDALRQRNAALMPGLRLANAGQLPSYLEAAFDTQRTGLQEGVANQERTAIARQDMGGKKMAAGGNLAATMNPAQMGQVLADAMTGSRVQQGMATVNQANTLMQMGLTGSAQSGNAAVGAAGNNLQSISMLPNYNPTYAAVLGGVNLAGTVYGAGKQGGWWGGGQQGPTGVPPTGTPYWYGGTPSTYGSGV